ncbi:MAG: hypothetical protein H6855_00310 [Rhodospirillales bacterium]|nr:hypothetical protein [Rhodospirillales bacterium]MCB9964511.1 hypothetical protein [Rhodospirillales bacterium]MCB9973784.1 hypothetical protein [Rhodospirillales bacterium]MCB9980332.1 hypothetical protein [Rhodospirillales bacterium]
MSQTTNKIMMMEPALFHSNPETMETNTYQAEDPENISPIHIQAVQEFRGLRDRLVEAGVIVVTAYGQAASPDDIFCNNWVATLSDRRMVLYPMLAKNRRIERRTDILEFLGRFYEVALDLSAEEQAGRYLESTGSHWLDRVNRIAYCGLSARTNKDLAERWCRTFEFEPVFFNTANHVGKPVYHTDVLMYIGSSVAGICSSCLLPEDRTRVLDKLSRHHDIVDLSLEQLRRFCGNSLEVRGTNDRKILAMSQQAYNAYTDSQKAALLKHVDEIVYSDISTIETYGGGSARCMLLELH